MSYDMEFTNGNEPFRKHFSADEFGILKKNNHF
jgi:hypothetical protein